MSLGSIIIKEKETFSVGTVGKYSLIIGFKNKQPSMLICIKTHKTEKCPVKWYITGKHNQV